MKPLTADDPATVGEFRLRARLGAGGMGRVYLGHSPAGRAVAVKICHRDLAANAAFVARFAREVAAARAVNGLFTAPVIAAGPGDDPPWLATAYVPGPSLYEAVAVNGPLPEAAVWRLAAGLAEALRAVHAQGLVHRDLKPTNVLLAADGPRVIDFGLARALDGIALTTVGTTFGTPSYMSPEQARGLPAGPASDVFSLGCVLTYAASGGIPFGDDAPPTVLYRVVHDQPVLDGVRPPLRDLVAACLAKDPGDRPGLGWLLSACQSLGPGQHETAFWPAATGALIASYENGPGATAARDTATRPRAIGRRRALAGIAGISVAGLGCAGWGLARLAASRRPATASRMIWRYPTDGPVSSGAVLRDGTIYIGSGDRKVYALDTGGSRAHTVLSTGGAISGALAIAGDQLIVASGDGTVHARSLGDGASWTFATGGPVTGAPAIANGAVYAGSGDHYVYALDQDTGRRLWRARTSGPVRSGPLAARPALAGLVYAGSADGHVYALYAVTGQVLWRFAARGEVNSGLTADANGNVYFGTDDGYLYSMSGSTDLDEWSSPVTGAVRGTSAIAGPTIYAGSAGSAVYAVDTGTGQQVWSCRTGGPVNSGLAVAGTVVYAGSDDGFLYAIDVNTGEVAWRLRTGGPVRSRILVAGGVVYFGSLDHHVYAVHA